MQIVLSPLSIRLVPYILKLHVDWAIVKCRLTQPYAATMKIENKGALLPTSTFSDSAKKSENVKIERRRLLSETMDFIALCGCHLDYKRFEYVSPTMGFALSVVSWQRALV